ncbi:MAG: hypothetical protein KJO82_05230 [Gammaproteobacteria bacterium]|nr:hypothetical protein [Gammaproteobacteria bacterium]
MPGMDGSRYTHLIYLSLWLAVVPLVAINVSYLVAVSAEHAPACIPHLSGCTSVSAVGRAGLESLIFKSGMLTSAIALVLLWHRAASFLHGEGASASTLLLLRVVAVFAAISLTLYALTLGAKGDNFRLLRRIGMDGFAIGNLIAQIIFIVLYRPLTIEATRKLLRWLIAFCIAVPLLGVASELAKWLGTPRRATNYLVAWNAFVAVSAYYAVLARVWWHHRRSDGRATSPSE